MQHLLFTRIKFLLEQVLPCSWVIPILKRDTKSWVLKLKVFCLKICCFPLNAFLFATSSHSFSIFPPSATSESYSIPDDVVGTTYIPLNPIFNPTPLVSQPLRKSLCVPTPSVWTKDYSCPTLSHGNLATSLYPLSNFLGYSHFSHPYQSFFTSISSDREPISYHEAILDHIWKEAMYLELADLESNHTWELVSLPVGKKPIYFWWVYKIKRHSNGIVLKPVW